MKIHLLGDDSPSNVIRRHDATSVTIGESTYTSSLIVSPSRLITDWEPETAKSLTAENLALLVGLDPELILIGTGARQHFPPTEILRSIITENIGYEIMDTGAACRTYNILVAEGRAVVAGLLLTD